MQNIYVRRFSTRDTNVQGIVEPEDKSWIVLLDERGEATFWRRCPDVTLDEPLAEDGIQRELYIDAELPGVGRLVADEVVPIVEPFPAPESLNPLDFTVQPSHAIGLDGGADPEKPGFWASLNVRSVTCFGETEHDAVRALLNYVAQLCTAGCLDHTGQPMPGPLRRRYDVVFGPAPVSDSPAEVSQEPR